MERTAVDAWVSRYVEAWRSNDPEAIGALFTDDAEYRTGPFDDPWRGRAEIVEAWLERKDEPGSWRFEIVGVHVAGDTAFVEGRAHYPDDGQRFANLWQLELDDGGRATRYVEWWMEPRRGAAEA
jgi:ketosteroid isomerase-like protein